VQPDTAQFEGFNDLQQKWALEVERRQPSTRERLAVEVKTMEDLLLNLSPDARRRQVALVIERKTGAGGSTVEPRFKAVVIGAYCKTLADSGDDRALTAALSTECPRFIGWSHIEFVMARSPLRDPVGVLVGAYHRSDNAANRRVIAAILTSAFPDIAAKFGVQALARRNPAVFSEADLAVLRERADSFDRFMRSCQRWCVENKASIRINDAYEYNDSEVYGLRVESLYSDGG
jgi:hypothetical protein